MKKKLILGILGAFAILLAALIFVYGERVFTFLINARYAIRFADPGEMFLGLLLLGLLLIAPGFSLAALFVINFKHKVSTAGWVYTIIAATAYLAVIIFIIVEVGSFPLKKSYDGIIFWFIFWFSLLPALGAAAMGKNIITQAIVYIAAAVCGIIIGWLLPAHSFFTNIYPLLILAAFFVWALYTAYAKRNKIAAIILAVISLALCIVVFIFAAKAYEEYILTTKCICECPRCGPWLM